MSRVDIEDYDEPRESDPLLDHPEDQIAIKPDNHATGDGHHQVGCHIMMEMHKNLYQHVCYASKYMRVIMPFRECALTTAGGE